MTTWLEIDQSEEGITFLPLASIAKIALNVRTRSVSVQQFGCVNGTTWNGVINLPEIRRFLRTTPVETADVKNADK